MKAWIDHNLHSLRLALSRLRATPYATLFSVLVIGVALSLPAGLYALLANAERAAGALRNLPEINLFLHDDVSAAKGRQLAEQLAHRPDLANVHFIDKEEGLRGMADSGLADIAAGLPENPLPHAISVAPVDVTPASLERLATELAALPGVEHLSMDADWAKRLAAILKFGNDLVWMLAALLGFALAAITGNTIRLQIYALREEIEVSRLIGATDRFIRRPFLYFGALQGLFGGLAGWGLVSLGLMVVDRSATRLAAAYGSQFHFTGLGLPESFLLVGSSALLGFIGAYLAVGFSLRSID